MALPVNAAMEPQNTPESSVTATGTADDVMMDLLPVVIQPPVLQGLPVPVDAAMPV